MKKSLILFILFFPLFITGFSFAETHSYYLPYFIADPGHWSGVALRNCNNSEYANATVTVYDEDGNEITTENKTLLPRGQEAWVVGVGLNQEGWMTVNSDQPLTGLCFFGTSDYMADITLMDTLSKTLYVPHVAQTSSEWDTTVLVCNPNDSTTGVTLTFRDTQGTLLYTGYYEIPANGSGRYQLSDLVEGSEQPSGSVEISASQGVAAFALYNNLKWGGYCYAGISAVEPHQEHGMTDEELIAMLEIVDDVHARAEALLASNPDPTSEELLEAIKEAPGVTASGIGAGPSASAWVEIGSGGPIHWVMMDPFPDLAQTQILAQAKTPTQAPVRAAAGLGNGKRYGFFSVAYPDDPIPYRIIPLLDSKKYERIISSVANLQTLRYLGALKILYITTHSHFPGCPQEGPCDIGPAIFSIMTAEALPPRPSHSFSPDQYPEDIRIDLAMNRLGVSSFCDSRTKMCKDVFHINENFVEKYFSFGDDSLFFLDACGSAKPDAAGFQKALFDKNLSVFVGWNAAVVWDDGWHTARLFFDRWLGTNQVDPPDPPQRAFDAESVRAELEGKGKDMGGPFTKLTVIPSPSGSNKFAGAPSTKIIEVKEKDKEMKLSGIYGTDPGEQRRSVKMGGSTVAVKEWKPEEITCELPASSGSSQVDVEVTADDHEGNKVQVTEWKLKFTQEGNAEIRDTETGDTIATSEGKYTFDVRFRGDVHDYREEAGEEPMNKVLVPFVIEDDGKMSWSGTATFYDETEPFSGTTTNIYEIDFTNPEWPLSLPDDTDLLAGEGYIDMGQRKLYLLLVGIGDNSGSGTFNLSPNTDCTYEHDQYTNRVYMIFNLDENFEIEDGSCTDQITDEEGSFTSNNTRSWEFTTFSPPDEEAER